MAEPADLDRVTFQDRVTLFIRLGVSLVLLGASLFVILSQRFPDDFNKWAFGMAGLVTGYWLR